jgi:hypothetical protein
VPNAVDSSGIPFNGSQSLVPSTAPWPQPRGEQSGPNYSGRPVCAGAVVGRPECRELTRRANGHGSAP